MPTDTRTYRRRATGELALDPALYSLVMTSAAVLDRLLCGSSPIVEQPPPARRRDAAAVGDREPIAG